MENSERGDLVVAFTLGMRCAQTVLNCRDDVTVEAIKLLSEVAAGRETMLETPRGMTDEDAGKDATKAVSRLLRASASLRRELQIAQKIVGLELGESAKDDNSDTPA
jgi:hypothetical protein